MNDSRKPKGRTIDLDLHNTRGNQSNLVLDHPESGGILDLFNFAAYQKTDGGWEYWNSSYAVAQNIDSDLWRDKDFRLQALIPTDTRPWDKNVYSLRPSGEIYAAISYLGWKRNRRLGLLKDRLAEFQASTDIYLDSGAVTDGMVEYFGSRWGKYIRGGDTDDSIPCAFSQCLEVERLGIFGHGFKRNNGYIKLTRLPDIPIKGMSKLQLEFHRSWSRLKEVDRIALWVHFVPRTTNREKAIALGMTSDGYRFLVDDAIDRVGRLMATNA